MPTTLKTTKRRRAPPRSVQNEGSLIGRGHIGGSAEQDEPQIANMCAKHVADVARGEDAEQVADEEHEEDVDPHVERHREPGHIAAVQPPDC